ncbi:MAG: PrgI family protein [Candidatus Pacearchaeota archaeon]
MGYEIPQQLEYQEKIMFGLNFKQLAYLFLFAPIIILVFFKTSLHLAIKIPIMTFFAGLAIGFIFLGLDKHLQNWYYWYNSKKIQLPHKFASFIPIKEVKDDLIITNDGRKLGVIKISPINFSIKPDESKQTIATAFQKFLNSLDFPVQIVMNTERLDLREYFAEVEKRIKDSQKFELLFKGYKTHLESLTKENEVMNRSFYLIIPQKTDIGIQLQICQTKLTNIGLRNVRLKTQDIEVLLRHFFLARPKVKEGNNAVSKEKY